MRLPWEYRRSTFSARIKGATLIHMWVNHLKSAAIFLAAGLSSVAVAYLLIELLMVGAVGLSYGDSARLFQAVGAITVIFVGGSFAYWRLQIFRTLEPHLSISHEVSHRRIGERYVHIAVTAKLFNNSKVKIELRRADFLLQLVSPVTDEEVVTRYADTFVHRKARDIQWETLEDIGRAWAEGESTIEPNESHQETCEFIISAEVSSVLIYTYFYNSRYSDNARTAQGWSATSVIDIMDT